VRLRSGEVLVDAHGVVTIRLEGLVAVATGAVAANKTLQVWLGSFTNRGFDGGALGTIATNKGGDYNGTIRTSFGGPFAFGPRTSISAHFALNDPGARTEFVTGFVIP
jgi:hypothetical protein